LSGAAARRKSRILSLSPWVSKEFFGSRGGAGLVC
jgi:hypothetical protein